MSTPAAGPQGPATGSPDGTGPSRLLLPGHEGAELRVFEDADANELHELIERNRPRLARWMRWARDQDAEQTLEFIRRARRLAEAGEGLELAIVADGRIAGAVGFPSFDRANHSGAIGYWLDASHEGRGLMTSAVAAVADHAFESVGLTRVEIHVDVENLRSRAVAERLGFRYEGTLRQAYWVGDRYSDDAVYSLLAEERSRDRTDDTRGER